MERYDPPHAVQPFFNRDSLIISIERERPLCNWFAIDLCVLSPYTGYDLILTSYYI